MQICKLITFCIWFILTYESWWLIVSGRIVVSVREDKCFWICLKYVGSSFKYLLWNAFKVLLSLQRIPQVKELRTDIFRNWNISVRKSVSVLFVVSCFELLLLMGLISPTVLVNEVLDTSPGQVNLINWSPSGETVK